MPHTHTHTHTHIRTHIHTRTHTYTHAHTHHTRTHAHNTHPHVHTHTHPHTHTHTHTLTHTGISANLSLILHHVPFHVSKLQCFFLPHWMLEKKEEARKSVKGEEEDGRSTMHEEVINDIKRARREEKSTVLLAKFSYS